MAVVQGGYVRRIPPGREKTMVLRGLLLIVPSFAFVGFAQNLPTLYFGKKWQFHWKFQMNLNSFLRPCSLRLVNFCGCAMHDNPSLPLRQRIAKRHCNGCLSISGSIGTCHGTYRSLYSILDDWSRSVLFHWRFGTDHSIPYVKILQNYLRKRFFRPPSVIHVPWRSGSFCLPITQPFKYCDDSWWGKWNKSEFLLLLLHH